MNGHDIKLKEGYEKVRVGVTETMCAERDEGSRRVRPGSGMKRAEGGHEAGVVRVVVMH